MNEDHEPLELDARVRAALTPDRDTVRRIAARARDGERPRAWPYRWRAAAALVAVLAALGALALWPPHAAAPAAPARVVPVSMLVSGRGSTIAVERSDGQRWVVDAASDEPHGSYVIVFLR